MPNRAQIATFHKNYLVQIPEILTKYSSLFISRKNIPDNFVIENEHRFHVCSAIG